MQCGRSGRKSAPSVSAICSSYQLNKSNATSSSPVPATAGRCDYCGGSPYSNTSRAVREKECRAFSMTCRKCQKPGHLAGCCKSKKVGANPAGKNAAVEKVEDSGTFETFAFCTVTTLPTSNMFAPLVQLDNSEWPIFPTPRSRPPGRKQAANLIHTQGLAKAVHSSTRKKAVVPKRGHFPVESDPVLPLPGHTIYPTTEVAEFMNKREKQTVRIPLCHMEYCKGADGVWAFRETSPLASPQLKISLKLHIDTYESMSLPMPVRTAGHSEKGVDTSGVADTGAQMDICSVSTVRSMGLDTTSLLPVKARVFGASKDAELNILGGIMLEVRPPYLLQDQVLSTVRLFYVASNVTKTYLSLGTLKALHVVEEEFPRIPEMVEIAASEEGEMVIPKCENTGVVLLGEKQL